MLEENVVRNEIKSDKKSPDSSRVTCFVCKQKVDRDKALQVDHPREKKVWVCNKHIK